MKIVNSLVLVLAVSNTGWSSALAEEAVYSQTLTAPAPQAALVSPEYDSGLTDAIKVLRQIVPESRVWPNGVDETHLNSEVERRPHSLKHKLHHINHHSEDHLLILGGAEAFSM